MVAKYSSRGAAWSGCRSVASRGGGSNLKVSLAHLCVRIFGRDHLALFGDADLPLHNARGLREDGLITRAATTAAMKTAAMIFALALVGSQALAQEQTRIYGPDGRSLGTAAPYGTGSVRYRDSRGRTTFTTTTMNGVTRFYDSGGHLTGTVIGSRRR